MHKVPCVYILASKPKGTLYVGVTSDLVTRCWQHKKGFVGGFTKTYKVHRLVYFELHQTMGNAITREKQIKKWNRSWKLSLIEGHNAEWKDLWDEIA